MPKHLTVGQLTQYRREGVTFPLAVLSAEDAAAHRSRLEAAEAHRPFHYLTKPYLIFGPADALARHPALLDAVEDVLGPDVLLWDSAYVIKEAEDRRQVGWHQDLTYWGLGETDNEVTAWIALTEASVESGCMRFMPGSHKQRLLEHEDSFARDNLLSRGQAVKADIDESLAVHAALRPGQISLHHGRLFHASAPNRSADRRIGLAIRYVTPEVRQQVAQRDYAILLRGVDRRHNWTNIAPPRRAFDRQSLERYERVLADQAEALAQNAAQELSTQRVR